MKNWQREAVGIEIFSGGARFVKLSSRQQKVALADFGEKALERGLPAFDRMADGFGKLLSGARVKIAFIGQSWQTNRLRVPAGLLSAGAEHLQWELEQKLASPGSEYDVFVHSAGKDSFLGTAVRKNLVEKTAAPFAKRGAADLSFSSSAFALVTLFFASDLSKEGAVALVNLAEDFTTLAVLDKGELTYACELPTPPGLGEIPQGELASTQALLRDALLERFGIELSTLLHLLGFRATEAGRIDTVYLAGPGVAFGELAAALGQMGGVRIGHLIPTMITFPEGEMAERWTVAAGLALGSLQEGETVPLSSQLSQI